MTITETNPIVPGVKTTDGVVARSAFMPAEHTHGINEVEGLTTTLGGKSDSSHNHSITALDGYTTLKNSVDGKASASHTHTTANVTGLDTALTSLGGRLSAVEANKADVSAVYTKTAMDSLLSAMNSRLSDIKTLSHDVDSNTPLDIASLENGELCYLHTSAASIALSSCITSSVSGTTIHYMSNAGSLTNRNFVIRKYRMGNHLFVEVVCAYD